jgi:hypothetical protein
MDANILVIVNQLAHLEVKAVKRYDLDIIDLHEDLDFVAKLQLRDSGVIQKPLCILQDQTVLLEAHKHVGDSVDTDT